MVKLGMVYHCFTNITEKGRSKFAGLLVSQFSPIDMNIDGEVLTFLAA